MSFKENDRVRVNAEGTHSQHGQLGSVDHVYADESTFNVQMDNGNYHSFFLGELEAADEKREALIELAETLDKARILAKPATPDAGKQALSNRIGGVLVDTLLQIVEETSDVAEVFDTILGGKSVREALEAVESDGE